LLRPISTTEKREKKDAILVARVMGYANIKADKETTP
jgi:hypothetical protein